MYQQKPLVATCVLLSCHSHSFLWREKKGWGGGGVSPVSRSYDGCWPLTWLPLTPHHVATNQMVLSTYAMSNHLSNHGKVLKTVYRKKVINQKNILLSTFE